LSILLRMTVFANLIHASTSSNPAEHHSRGGKGRTRHLEQIAVQHVDERREIYQDTRDRMTPLLRSRPIQQLRDTRTRTFSDMEGRESEIMLSSVDTQYAMEPINEMTISHERFPSSNGILSRELGHREEKNKKKRRENNHKQQPQPQHQQIQHELNQQQYTEITLASSRNSADNDDGMHRPKGVVVRRGRLFHNNIKGSKRNGKALKWSKSSKSTSWDDCYWEDAP
jgi:hypothetical protein